MQVTGSVGVGFCWSTGPKLRRLGSNTVWWVSFGVSALNGAFACGSVEEAPEGAVPGPTGM